MEHLQSQSCLTIVKEPLQSQALSSKDDEQVLTTLDKPEQIFKIVPHKKAPTLLTPEEKKERLKRTYQNYINKANGIIVEKPTIK
jgi:hypothetical protein